MRKLGTILLLTICLSLQAQNWRGLAVVGYHVGAIALGAVADGLYDEGHKEWGHALHAVEIGAVIAGPFVHKIKGNEALTYILSYGFLRFSLFDSFYNLTRDLPLLYSGSTSGYDKAMSKIPEHGRAWYKGCSLVVGIAIPIKEIR